MRTGWGVAWLLWAWPGRAQWGLAAELRPDGAWPIVVGVAGVGEDAGWLWTRSESGGVAWFVVGVAGAAWLGKRSLGGGVA